MNERDASSGVPRTEENIGGSNVKQKIQFGHRHFIFVKYCEVFRRLHTFWARLSGIMSANVGTCQHEFMTKVLNTKLKEKTRIRTKKPRIK